MVQLTEHDALSRETIRRRFAENDLKPWRRDMWCIPDVDGAYVAWMEDVLDLYAEGHDPKRPVVCFDESPHQLIGKARQPIHAEPGQPPGALYEAFPAPPIACSASNRASTSLTIAPRMALISKSLGV
jgi:hypothetical protein